MMKKIYIQPEMKVVTLQETQNILAGSDVANGGQASPATGRSRENDWDMTFDLDW